jgi:hypothetical protein
LEQGQLENWAGGRHAVDLPKESNRYLFSALGSVSRAELRTASRAWIVFLASGAALAAGLVLIYVPRSRHPAVLLIAAVALGGLLLLYPETTLLLAQAASVGLALTVIAVGLRAMITRRRRVVPRSSGRSPFDKSSTQSVPKVKPAEKPSSTRTAVSPASK